MTTPNASPPAGTPDVPPAERGFAPDATWLFARHRLAAPTLTLHDPADATPRRRPRLTRLLAAVLPTHRGHARILLS